MSDQSYPQAHDSGRPANDDLIRLGTLVATVLEAGSRKAERDVLDDLCMDFGIDIGAVEAAARRGTLTNPFRRVRAVQRMLGVALAERATTVEALATAVLRRTEGFVAMLDEIYRCLGAAHATAGGNCEAFRLRAGGVDLGVELSPAFFERVTSLVRTLTTIEIGAIDEEKVSRFLAVDGDFYGSWPPDRQNRREARNLARELSHLPWLRTALGERRDLARQRPLHDMVEACCSAADTFVGSALRLVQAHVRMLEDDDPTGRGDVGEKGDAEVGGSDSRAQRLVAERALLREHGLLRGGLRARAMGLRGTDEDWTHVRVERLFAPPHTLGGAPGCVVVIPREVLPDSHGTTVGALACLCGLWKAGVKRVPDGGTHLSKLAAEGTAETITAWLEGLGQSLRAASEWLTQDVWTPTGAEEREEIAEVLEDYLRLPLWRQRWLLYEVWLIVVTMAAAERAGWHADLELSRSTDGAVGVWTLPKGAAAKPCATMSLHDTGARVHVWYQGRWRRSGTDMMPDVALTTTESPPRDLIVVEGKDRYRMPLRGLRGGALDVGRRYSDASAAVVTWIVNYCSFAGLDGVVAQAQENHGSDWRALFLAPEMRPGRVRGEFIATIGAALQPLAERVKSIAHESRRQRTLVFVCDTTGSMHVRLDGFWDAMHDLLIAEGCARGFAAFRALLFGDHDRTQDEPYLLRHIGPALDLAVVIENARREPLTNGGDEPEALEDAMRACRETAQRLDGSLCCVVLTDAPPHAVEECPQRIDFRAEVDELLAGGSICMLVSNWLSPSAAAAWAPFDAHPRFFRIDLDRKVDVRRLFDRLPALET